MTEAVRTDGFNGVPGVPNPMNMKPGMMPLGDPNIPNPEAPVVPVAPAVAPAAAPAAPAAPGTPDLSAAIAALTAALAKPAVVEPAEPEGTQFGDLNEYDINSISDPIIRSMATVLQTTGKGVDLNRAIGLAIDRGDPGLVDVAYLKEAGGAQSEQLITIARGIVNAIEAKANEVTSGIHSLAGGEPQWNASAAAFNTAAPNELKLVAKQMLDSNNPELINAAAKIIVEFGKSSGTVPRTAPSVSSGAASLPAAMALDKIDFQTELRKLDKNDRKYQEKHDELFARRQLGKRMGK